MELSRENCSAVDSPYWAYTNGLLIDGRPFTLEGREYQLEIMRPGTDDGKVKEGEVISRDLANVLSRMGVPPVTIGLELAAAFEDGTV